MTSKTSCFNRAIFRRACKKIAPLAALYTLAWLVLLPLSLPTVYEQHIRTDTINIPDAFAKSILTSAGPIAGLAAFVYGLALAWLLYSWLFRTTNAYFQASLPVRREALFMSNYCAGLLGFLAPHALVALVTFLVSAAYGVPQAACCAQWFCMASLDCLFFYSFAVLLAMIVGQMAMMPLVYLILNFTVFAIYSIVAGLMGTFVYGMSVYADRFNSLAVMCSPPLAFVSSAGPHVISPPVYQDGPGFVPGPPELTRTWYAWILGAIGILFAALAFLLLKKREMERCGDVVAVRSLRPVFLYAFTIGCALVIGALIAWVTLGDIVASNFWLIMLFLIVGAFIGYFCAQMMLKKTVRVFSSGWLGLGACCLALLAVFGAARLDVFGYSRHIPEADEVKSVSVDFGSHGLLLGASSDAEAIAGARALHAAILENRTAQEQLSRSTEPTVSRNITICYELTNGQTLSRYYELYAPQGSRDESNPLIQFVALYNSLPFVYSRNLPDFPITEKNVATCYICGTRSGPDGEEDNINLSSADAYDFYINCILPDLADSSLGRRPLGELVGQPAATAEAVETVDKDAFNYTPGYVEFTFRTADGGETNSYFSVPLDAKRTVAYLEKLGFSPLWEE